MSTPEPEMLSQAEVEQLVVAELEGAVHRLECGCCAELLLRYTDGRGAFWTRRLEAEIPEILKWLRGGKPPRWDSKTAPCGRYIWHTVVPKPSPLGE